MAVKEAAIKIFYTAAEPPGFGQEIKNHKMKGIIPQGKPCPYPINSVSLQSSLIENPSHSTCKYVYPRHIS